MPSIMWARHTSGGNPGPRLSFLLPTFVAQQLLSRVLCRSALPGLVCSIPGLLPAPHHRGQRHAQRCKAIAFGMSCFPLSNGFPSLQPNLLLLETARTPSQQGRDLSTPWPYRGTPPQVLGFNSADVTHSPIWSKSTPLLSCSHQMGDAILRADGDLASVSACTQPCMHFIEQTAFLEQSNLLLCLQHLHSGEHPFISCTNSHLSLNP